MTHVLYGAAGGGLLALAFPSVWSVEPVAGLAPVGLALILRTGRIAGRWPVLVGLAVFGAGAMGWLAGSLSDRFGALGLVVWPVVSLYGMSYLAVAAGLARGAGAWAPLALPAFWYLAERVRADVLGGFDWLALGYTQVDTPLGQHLVAELGVHAVSGLVVLLAGLLAASTRTVAVVGWVLVGVLSYMPCDCPPLVGGRAHEDLTIAVLDGVTGSWDADVAGPAHFAVAPEGALGDRAPPADLSLPLLTGALTDCPDVDERPCRQNSVLLIEPGGRIASSYAKRRLVPLWEADFLGLRAARPSRLQPGTRPGMVDIAGVTLGILLCYESTDAEMAVDLARRGARALLHPTSDTWQSSRVAADQHRMIARARALETGLALLRVSDRGLSALVDRHGRWLPVASNSIANMMLKGTEP